MIIINNIKFEKFGDTEDEFYFNLSNKISNIIRLKVLRLPERYSPDGVWSESVIEDLTNDFISPESADDNSSARNRLAEIFDKCSTEQEFSSSLNKSISNFVSALGKNDESRKLYHKIKEVLNNSHNFFKYKELSNSNFEKWGLKDWAPAPNNYLVSKNIYEIQMLIKDIPHIERKEYKRDILESPIVALDDLEKLLIRIFNHTRVYLTIPELKNLLETKLTIFRNSTESLDAKIQTEDNAHTLGDTLSANTLFQNDFIFYDTALFIYQQLNAAERAVLHYYYNFNKTFVEIGGLLSVSKSSASNYLNAANEKIKNELEDDSDAEEILKILLKIIWKNISTKSIDNIE
ncbi:MAG TPA: hypothetical protein PKY81_07300 [bacterium]|nr:hypothetical protein [bacterium]